MTLSLIRDKRSVYSIIIPHDAAPSERKAAEELSLYLEKIGGAKLPIFADDVSPTPFEILLGQTNREVAGMFDREGMGMNGFAIRTVGEKLFLAGSDAHGTLYAVYEFLEKYLDCRFYTARFEKVPKREEVCLPEIHDVRRAGFCYRALHWYDYLQSDEFCAKRKINWRKTGRTMSPEYGTALRYCNDSFGHTIYRLAEMTGDHIDAQPCLSDEHVYQMVLKNVREWLKNDPDAHILSISQNDTHSWSVGCTCERCQKTLEETGSYSGSWIRFINRLAEELEEEYPNLLFHTFAYRFTRQPPENIRLHKNILVELCTIEACFRHPIDECGTVGEEHIAADDFPLLFKKWAALAPRLAVWDYTTNFQNYNLPHPNFAVLRKNIRFFAEHSATYLFEQGNAPSPSGEFSELRSYLLAKMMWDPYMSAEQYRTITEEFIDDFYGNGAPFIKEYLQLVLDYTAEQHVTTFEPHYREYPNIPTSEEKLLPGPVLTEGKRLFEAALKAESDPVLHENIARASIQIDQLWSIYGFERLMMARALMEKNLKKADPTIGDEKLRTTVNQVMEAEQDTYRAENRALAEKMLRCGVRTAAETIRIDGERALNFDRHILQWGDPAPVIPE